MEVIIHVDTKVAMNTMKGLLKGVEGVHTVIGDDMDREFLIYATTSETNSTATIVANLINTTGVAGAYEVIL